MKALLVLWFLLFAPAAFAVGEVYDDGTGRKWQLVFEKERWRVLKPEDDKSTYVAISANGKGMLHFLCKQYCAAFVYSGNQCELGKEIHLKVFAKKKEGQDIHNTVSKCIDPVGYYTIGNEEPMPEVMESIAQSTMVLFSFKHDGYSFTESFSFAGFFEAIQFIEQEITKEPMI
jgi:hypothetical protein